MPRLINRHPSRTTAVALGFVPFIAVLILYVIGSEIRLAENPNDKLLPAFSTMWDGIIRYGFEPSKRTGEYLLWVDTFSSLARLSIGVFCATLLGLVVGIAVGLLPFMRSTLATFMAVLSMIPPLAVLPILFIIFGLGEVSKVVLIVFGIAPFLMRDVALRVGEIPTEQIIKAQTLGASTLQLVTRVVLPQIMPRMFDAVRLSLGAAWLFLIAAEAIASESGLGYRIFLLRRYLSMDVILPYVLWITLLAFIFDWGLRVLQHRLYPWFAKA